LKATGKWQSSPKIIIRKQNITSLTKKKHKLVEEAKQYALHVVDISSKKGHESNTVELDNGWELVLRH